MKKTNYNKIPINPILELENFEVQAKRLEPDEEDIPNLKGIDIYGGSIELYSSIGGDHLILSDYKKRFNLEHMKEKVKKDTRFTEEAKKNIINKLEQQKSRAGKLIADVAGHFMTDALLTGRLHDTFLALAKEHLEQYGEITKEMIESINDRIYDSSSFDKNISAIFGEITEQGRFRFISAGHPIPKIYSNKFNKFVNIDEKSFLTYDLLGIKRTSEKNGKKKEDMFGYKDRYTVNEINLLGQGDILILYTDGLSDLSKKIEYQNEQGIKINNTEFNYFPQGFESTIRNNMNKTAKEIYHQIEHEIMTKWEREDDITYVIIKKID